VCAEEESEEVTEVSFDVQLDNTRITIMWREGLSKEEIEAVLEGRFMVYGVRLIAAYDALPRSWNGTA
jgi:hypothetical protein